MWFTMALLTILFWGLGDLFTKQGTKPNDPYSHLRMLTIVGAVMGVHAIAYWILYCKDYSLWSMVEYLPVSLMYISSMAIGYAGLRYLELSISSPVGNCSGAVTAILCAVFLGQRTTTPQFFAIAFICIGLFMLAVLERKAEPVVKTQENKKYRTGMFALIFPLLYCVIDGLGTFFDAYYLDVRMTEAQANISYELTFLLAGIAALCYLVFVKKQKFRPLDQKFFGAAALCETAGQFFYVYAMSGDSILAAPMIASYSILSVLLSRIFLKEKLSWAQYGVIAVIMGCIAVLGIE